MLPGDDMAAIRRIISDLSPRQREALKRFYVLGQNKADILKDLKMDEVEFLKLKTESMARWNQHRQKRKPSFFERFFR